jgi:DNA-binding response OmpR family regulator
VIGLVALYAAEVRDTTPAWRERTGVLLIAEHPGMHQLLRLILCGLEMDVHEAGPTYVLAESVRTLPRLVVVDFDISLQGGLQSWRELRLNPMAATIPSVFLVEAGEERLHRLATTAGATICLDKPFRIRDLRRIARCLLSEPEIGQSYQFSREISSN